MQLSDPKAKEVFEEGAWDKICDRAEAVQLQVRPAVPTSINADLRPYQVEGFHYLAYLASNGFGGILADDMGLGKTVQSLTWIMWLREQSKDPGTVLVICPKSVLDVWAAEMKKFAPTLRVQVLRSKDELDMDVVREKIDVLVVNYSQLRVCEVELNTENWLAAILDEGQQIKNPDSKAAKAARALTSENRLVLTGTPIENRLLDIWSLMSFAMPGVLGGRKYFRDRFDRRKDPQSQMRLSARMRPFLLRRTKGQVAMDLPPRTEENVLCKMEGVQAEMYQGEMERIQKVLLGLETDEALRKNSFVVLQGLMRLRQICCHPALIDQKHIEEESAKMTALFYLLDQLHEEGHKVLVFSQFVTMLDIIKARLATENRKFNYLTGQTKDRQAVIEDFQTTEDPSVFLLSLKAGGSGLNLTSASYVILYDPWWNPAVENQAIDRTHRIGQKNKVIAYRLIMGDSVEEKIRTLQEQKEVLAGGVLGEESFARNLELKDIQFLFQPDEPDTIEAELVEG
ncbi:MAG: SNF2 family DNA or RNA helicase [Pseudoalteromonas tetraodonis]